MQHGELKFYEVYANLTTKHNERRNNLSFHLSLKAFDTSWRKAQTCSFQWKQTFFPQAKANRQIVATIIKLFKTFLWKMFDARNNPVIFEFYLLTFPILIPKLKLIQTYVFDTNTRWKNEIHTNLNNRQVKFCLFQKIMKFDKKNLNFSFPSGIKH